MALWREMSKEQLQAELAQIKQQYKQFQNLHLSLNMARGKPAPDQLDLSDGVLSAVTSGSDVITAAGEDTRNYGMLEGIPEARKLFADVMEVSPDQVIVGGNSSLSMMFDVISQGMTTGFGNGPWSQDKNRKFLCPAPGYDRHFAITEYFGFTLIPVAMLSDGPDMDEVERLIQDRSVKGIWCVPKYSNPQGITYSDDVVARFAALKPAAPDFKIMWDNAYAVHHLHEHGDHLANLFDLCKQAGTEDMVVEFTSTSKITYAGAGVAALAVSPAMKQHILRRMTMQTISADKINQLRHAKLFGSVQDIERHMQRHAAILAPKFDLVDRMLTEKLEGTGILAWSKPNGGYFISVDTLPGCAKRVVELCKNAGVTLTSAGATFPYGNDPLDSNIRLAPSYPSLDELEKATELFILSVKYATAEMLCDLA